MHKLFFKILMTALVLILMTANLLSGCASKVDVSSDTIIRIGLLPDVNSLPFLIAQEVNLFQKEGIRVEVTMFKSAPDRDAALQSRNIDGADSDILSAALMIQAGFKMTVTSYTDGRYALIAAPETGIQEAAQLKGREIAISSNTIIDYVAHAILTKKGLKPDEIRTVAIPQIPVRMEMLASGKVQAACMPDPFAALAVARGGFEITDSIKMNIQPGVMVFDRAFAEKNIILLKKLYQAYDKAAGLLNTKGDQYRDLIVQKAGFPQETRDILKFPHYQTAVIPSQEDVAGILSWMKNNGLLKKNITYQDIILKDVVE